MAPRGVKKRVRIQSGHEARYIEQRGTRKRSKKKPILSKGKLGGKIGSHRLTVSELVYQFLEKASRCGVHKSRKSNATSQFRKLQRHNRSKKIKSAKRTPNIVRSINDDDDAPVQSEEGHISIEKCIYDVLSFGTIMGLLQPVDDKGVVFRVASDLNLFDGKSKRNEKTEAPCDSENDDVCECGD